MAIAGGAGVGGGLVVAVAAGALALVAGEGVGPRAHRDLGLGQHVVTPHLPPSLPRMHACA